MIGFLARALAVTLGLQTLRAFFPLLLYVLKDRFGQPSTLLGLEAVLLFATGFLVPRLVRTPRGVATAILVLAGLRGALQAWKGDPAVSLAIAAAGVPVFLAVLAARSAQAAPAFLAGAVLDVAIHAAAGTRDLHWGGGAAEPAAGVLIGTALGLGWAMRRAASGEGDSAGSRAGAFAWGPLVLLQLEILGNVARASARTGMPTATSGACVAGGLALALALVGHRRIAPLLRPWGIAAAALVLLILVPVPVTGPAAAAALLAVQLAAGIVLAGTQLPPARPVPALGRELAFGSGSVALVLLLFLHYAGYDLPLPLAAPEVWRLAAVLLVVGALALRADRPPPPLRHARPIALAGLLVAAVPLLRGVPRAPVPVPDPDGAVVVTFNLHAGFDERGGFAFDRMMTALREARPDVVALQEVSRGWVINGCADLFELARERLGFEGTAGPSIRSDWGNAVLARAPVLTVRTVALPPPMHLARAATRVELAASRGPRVVIATHLHHRTEDDAIRDTQAAALAERFQASADAVLLGDFNALPESVTFAVLRSAGWLDSAGEPEEAGRAPTYPARDPVRRIDTILVGDRGHVAACEVCPPWGSDHCAVRLRWNSVGSGGILELR